MSHNTHVKLRELYSIYLYGVPTRSSSDVKCGGYGVCKVKCKPCGPVTPAFPRCPALKSTFFGVETKLVRIDDSRPAPLFKLVSQPNEWQKTVSRSKAMSGRAEAYQLFWQRFLEKLKEQAPDFTNAQKGLPQNWYNIGAGRSGFAYGAAFKQKERFAVELTIDTGDKDKNKQSFDRLYREKGSIEQELNMSLDWERLDTARLSRIATYRPGTIDSTETELDELRDWAVSTLIRFSEVFGKRIRAL